MQARRRNF